MRPSAPRARLGFTLVELLVVISIIAILIALLLVAVSSVVNKGDEAVTLNEIRQLTISVDNFKQKFGILPPSKITLCGNGGTLLNSDATSYAYLNAIWPRLDWTGGGGPIDWTGTGQTNAIYTLEGDQCLVFFLGGIPDPTGACRGFSPNPKNPAAPPQSAGEQRISFYQFDDSRLFKRTGSPYYSYKDNWNTGQPYAFFSSGKRQNGYNPSPASGPGGDCPSLIRLGPYWESGSNPIRYYNSSRFQIISAGKNGLFGPGGPWSPALATTIGDSVAVGGTMVQTGIDDQSNFYDAKLGVPQ